MYTIRSYLAGDEAELIRIFNRRYGKYPGSVWRTEEYWRWCCLQRPGVASDGVRVVTEGHRILGYAVVSRSGTVLEFSYEPGPDSEPTIRALLVDVICYVKNSGARTIRLSVPADDALLRQVLEDLGFDGFHPKTLAIIRCVDYPGLLRTIVEGKGAIGALEHERVLIKLSGEPPSGIESFVIERDRIVAESSRRPTFTVKVSKPLLLSMIVGRRSSTRMLFRGGLKVSPFWKIPTALRLLTALRLDSAWFTPDSDRG